MPDLKKVIKGLRCHLMELTVVGKPCFDCPYRGDNPCEIQLITDALILLRETEKSTRISWVKEKLDEINNVLDLWEGR